MVISLLASCSLSEDGNLKISLGLRCHVFAAQADWLMNKNILFWNASRTNASGNCADLFSAFSSHFEMFKVTFTHFWLLLCWTRKWRNFPFFLPNIIKNIAIFILLFSCRSERHPFFDSNVILLTMANLADELIVSKYLSISLLLNKLLSSWR